MKLLGVVRVLTYQERRCPTRVAYRSFVSPQPLTITRPLPTSKSHWFQPPLLSQERGRLAPDRRTPFHAAAMRNSGPPRSIVRSFLSPSSRTKDGCPSSFWWVSFNLVLLHPSLTNAISGGREGRRGIFSRGDRHLTLHHPTLIGVWASDTKTRSAEEKVFASHPATSPDLTSRNRRACMR